MLVYLSFTPKIAFYQCQLISFFNWAEVHRVWQGCYQVVHISCYNLHSELLAVRNHCHLLHVKWRMLLAFWVVNNTSYPSMLPLAPVEDMGRLQECLCQTCFSLKGGSRVVAWLGWGVPSWLCTLSGLSLLLIGNRCGTNPPQSHRNPHYKFQARKVSAQGLAWDVTLPVCSPHKQFLHLFISVSHLILKGFAA